MALSRRHIAPLGVIASLIAAKLIVNDYPHVIDVFRLADPTGTFGVYDHLGGLLANGAVIFVALAVLFRSSEPDAALGSAVVVFVPSVIEAIAGLPCMLPRPGALCGIFLVLVSWYTIPVVLVAAAAFILGSRSRRIKAAGLSAAMTFLGAAGLGVALLLPTAPAQCHRLQEVTKRSTCLNTFAQRNHDEALCRSIEFRTTRFSCLRDVAVFKGEVRLCEEIRDQSPVKAYESPAAFYRDGCFQNLAYRLHDPGQCLKVEDLSLRMSCQHALQ